jgi:geranylgeranyl diphosphate synthase, type II
MLQKSSSSYSEITQQFGPRIDAALDARTARNDGCPSRLHEAMRYSLLAPGKRLRPVLVLLATEACGGESEAAIPAACAVEMVHAYSLIHDDLPAMDDDDLRRGRPTCHKAFGEATAILAGDALLTLAFEVLAKEIRPPEVAAACCAALAEAAGAAKMVGGQASDIDAEHGGTSANGDGCQDDGEQKLALLESIHRRKTGAMIQVSLKLGGLVARANGSQMTALDSFGRRVGLTFQITDDLLDVQSNEAALGKRVRKDAEHGKLTFPRLLGIDQSAQYARLLTVEACRNLDVFGSRGEGLRNLAWYVVGRNH